LNRNDKNKTAYILLILIIISNILLTLPVISRPLYSINDSTRQIHTAGITRDLYNNNYNIFNTKIYFSGTKITYTEELPIYNVLVVIGYKIFGVHEIIGRIIALLLFQASLVVFYLLLRSFCDIGTSLLSVFIFSFSYYSLYYNDFFQPTSMDILLLLLHLYFFSRFLFKDSTANYILWLLFATLNFVERPIFLVLILPIIVFLLKKYGWFFWLKPKILLFFAVTFGLTAAWYIYGYLMTGNTIPGFYIGYFTPFRIFNKNTHYYIIKFISFLFKSLFKNFTAIGSVMLIIGIFFNAGKKQYRFVALWMLSIILQMFLIASKVIVHQHYLVPLFLSMSFFTALPLAALSKKLEKLKIKNAEFIFFSAFILFYIFNITPDAIHKKSQINTYIEPISKRISAKSKPDDNIIFFGDRIQDVWSNSLLYATNRCGLMLDLDTDAVGIINKYRSKYGLSYIAALKIKKGRGSSNPPECKNMNWLLSKFRLVDQFKDAYFLLDARTENKQLKAEKDFLNLDLRFSNGCALSGIQISDIYKKDTGEYADITMIWETHHDYNDKRDLYLVSVIPESRGVNLTHKIFGDVYPASRWRPDKYYSETLSIPLVNKSSRNAKTYISFALFDPVSGSILKPAANNSEIVVVELDILNRKAQVLDISMMRKSEEYRQSFKKMTDNNVFKETVCRNYLCYRNMKNIENTLQFGHLQLQGFYP